MAGSWVALLSTGGRPLSTCASTSLCTETGVYVSFDGGANWQSLQLNLPNSPIHDLIVKNDDLVVATHGRSFWILDDLTPLHQLTDTVAQADVYLFKPRATYRLEGGGGFGGGGFGGFGAAAAPILEPGVYTIRLTVGSKTLTSSVNVLEDIWMRPQ